MPTQNSSRPRLPDLQVLNATLRYKNFSGVAKKFNAKGLRNFHIVLDNAQAKQLEKDGWNIRWHKSREEGEPDWPSLKVAVRYDNFPPKVMMILGKNKVMLDDQTVGLLDDAQIIKADVVVTASYWEANGSKGFKAYLKKAFVTMSPNDIEAHYMLEGIESPEEDD